ncbi:uncharacterized protein AB9W97_009645 [Spinachia spinachia]
MLRENEDKVMKASSVCSDGSSSRHVSASSVRVMKTGAHVKHLHWLHILPLLVLLAAQASAALSRTTGNVQTSVRYFVDVTLDADEQKDESQIVAWLIEVFQNELQKCVSPDQTTVVPTPPQNTSATHQSLNTNTAAANTTLQNNITTTAAANTTLQNNITTTAAANTTLQNNITTTAAANTTLQNNITTTAAANTTLQNNITTTAAANTTLQNNITTTAAANTTLQNNITTTAAANTTLQNNITTTAAANTTLQNNITTTAAANTTLQNNITTTAAANATLQNNITTTAAVNTTLQNNITTTAAANTTLQNNITTTAATNTTLQNNITTTAAANTTLQNNITTTAAANTTLQNNITTTAAANTTLQNNITTTAAANATLQNNITTTAAVNATLQNNITTTAVNITLQNNNTTGAVPTTTLESNNTTTIVPTTTFESNNTTTAVPTTTLESNNTTTAVPTTTLESNNTTTAVPTTTLQSSNTTSSVPTTTLQISNTTTAVQTTTSQSSNTTTVVLTTTLLRNVTTTAATQSESTTTTTATTPTANTTATTPATTTGSTTTTTPATTASTTTTTPATTTGSTTTTTPATTASTTTTTLATIASSTTTTPATTTGSTTTTTTTRRPRVSPTTTTPATPTGSTTTTTTTRRPRVSPTTTTPATPTGSTTTTTTRRPRVSPTTTTPATPTGSTTTTTTTRPRASPTTTTPGSTTTPAALPSLLSTVGTLLPGGGQPNVRRVRRAIRSQERKTRAISEDNLTGLFQEIEVSCAMKTSIRSTNCSVMLLLKQTVPPCCILQALCAASKPPSDIHATGKTAGISPLQNECDSSIGELDSCTYTGPSGAACNLSETAYVVAQRNSSHCGAAEAQANALLGLTGDVSRLNSSQVSQLVSQLEGLLSGPNVSLALGNTSVHIVSNLLGASPQVLADSSDRIIRIVDTVGLKLVLDEKVETLLSPAVALSVKPVDGTNFQETVFSISDPNAVQVQGNPRLGRSPRADPSIPQGSITLPPSLTQDLSVEEQRLANRVQFNFYQKSTVYQDRALGNRRLNSGILGASVANLSLTNLRNNVIINLRNFEPVPANYVAVCVFWDFTLNDQSGGWNPRGCVVQNSTDNVTTVCGCNHLTSFAILLDLSRQPVLSREQATILSFITYIGCGISSIFLSITLLTYLAFGKLRKDTPSKILIQLCLALLLLNLVFLVDAWLALYTDTLGLCISTAWFLHYFLLVTFTWMGLEAVQMYLALVKVFNTHISHLMVKFSLVGWGVPMIVVIIVIAVDKNNYGLVSYGNFADGTTDGFCWLKNDIAFYVAVVAYFCIVFLFNVAMFIVVLVQLCRIKKQNPHNVQLRTTLQDVRSVAGIMTLLGLTWGFAFFAWGPLNLPFMYLFAIFNSLQGFFIFVLYCATKENVRNQWRTYLCCGRMRLAKNSEWSRTATQKTAKRSSEATMEHLHSSASNNNSSFLVSDSSELIGGIGSPFDDRTITANEDPRTDAAP